VKNAHQQSADKLTHFLDEIDRLRRSGTWDKSQIVDLFEGMIPEFEHAETGKYLDQKM
jgi:hypothetical protein